MYRMHVNAVSSQVIEIRIKFHAVLKSYYARFSITELLNFLYTLIPYSPNAM